MSAPLKTLALLALLGLAGCGDSATTTTSAVSPPAGASQTIGGPAQAASATPALTPAQLAAIAEEDAAVQAAEQNVDGTAPTQTR